MSITTVSPETAIPLHYESCTRDAIGAVVLKLIADGRSWPHDLVFLRSMAEAEQAQPEHCRCLSMRLEKVTADLAARRKAQRAGYERSGEIASLIVARDAIRAAIEATR